MRYLLDTCTFIWLCAEPDRLSALAKQTINQRDISLTLSHVSVLEIALKWNAGKIMLPAPPRLWICEQIERWQVDMIPLTLEDIYRASEIPQVHSDPFDRLLVATAIGRRLAMLTPDEWMRKYPVQCVW